MKSKQGVGLFLRLFKDATENYLMEYEFEISTNNMFKEFHARIDLMEEAGLSLQKLVGAAYGVRLAIESVVKGEPDTLETLKKRDENLQKYISEAEETLSKFPSEDF